MGLLIPPSIILIIYGVTVQESIAKLFVAGIIPGIMIALIFMSYVILWSLINKNQMPDIVNQYSFIDKIKRSGQLIPVIILILSVIVTILYLLSIYIVESIVLYNFEYQDEIIKRMNVSLE